MSKKVSAKKMVGIFVNIILYLFLAICVLAVVVTIVSKKDSDGAAEIFGYQMRVVTSDSMAKCEETDVSVYDIKSIPIRSMVFVKVVPQDAAEADAWYGQLKVGDVLTFRYVYTSQVTITHRITSIEPKETGGYIIKLEGDNKNANTEQLEQTIDTSIENSTNYVIGKVVAKNYLLGLLVTLLKNPVGIVLIIIVPCFIIILLEVLKIVGVLNAEKKKREQEEHQKKDSEIEELRRKLAQLEQEKSSSPQDSETKDLTPEEENKKRESEEKEESHE